MNMVIANHMFEHLQNWTNLICTQSYMYSYKENQCGLSAWHCLAPKNADEVPKIIKKLKGCQTISYKNLKLSNLVAPCTLRKKARVAVCSVLRGAVLTRTWSALASTNGGIVNRTLCQQCKVVPAVHLSVSEGSWSTAQLSANSAVWHNLQSSSWFLHRLRFDLRIPE